MQTFGDTIIGVLLAILAAAMFSFGVIFQKKGVQDLPNIKMSDLKTITPMIKNKTWLIGVIIGAAGGLPYIASQSYIGIGYTQLMLSTGLIILAYGAIRMLHERLGLFEWSGISCIVAGTIFLGLAQMSDVNVTLSSPNFFSNALLFYIIFSVLIAVGLIVYKITSWGAAKNLAINSGIWFGLGAVSSQIGTLGLEEWNLLVAAFGYLILLAGNAISTLIVNVAFQKGKAVLVIPIQSSGNYLIPVFAGIFLFQQTFLYSFFFWPSVICIMAGVILLARIQAELEKPRSDAGKKEEISDSPR
jgi:drug/metabolite transporter (DMT)-like permease